MEMKCKMDTSEEMLNNVCKKVEDLENKEQYEDYGGYGEDCIDLDGNYDFGQAIPTQSGSKRPLEGSKDDNNNARIESDSRFSFLAKRFKGQEKTSSDIDPVLADNITDLFRKGMDDDQYNDLLKDDKLARPANCDGLAVVKCNQLVWDLLPPNARTNDIDLQSNIDLTKVSLV
ncbi:hypothetical protein DPMN_160362 [Dreissena polymorpha]|uniref:Uncharacterized protein n=1 Tax=Dreissena polymorpha TaxID=45954 RepID=A0A9D4ER29_DREPO|nr:hypothetical protein DPMN_160362 [Dreissena polymorpha]